jgi:ATP-dependent Clp endopeptidase proteolytic subunit ClpP
MTRILIALFLCITAMVPARTAQAETLELTDRLVLLNGAINAASIAKAIKEVMEFEAQSNDPIWLMIDSFGGSVDAGFILIDVIRSIQSPVHAIVTGKAYSMGAIITVYCPRRYIFPHATMMFHEASYGALGEDPSIRSRMEFNSRYLDRIHVEIAELIGMPVEDYRNRIRDAWWVLAPEAVEAGFVEAVVTSVTYDKLPTETVEIKRTTTIKTRSVTRPSDTPEPSQNSPR